MEIVQIAQEIQKRIKLLSDARKILHDRAEKKAESIANYDKVMATTIMKLKNSDNVTLDDGTVYTGPFPVSIIDKIARGICWREKLEMEKADGLYRVAVSGISSLESELNGLQSIFRYMKEL